MYIIIFFTESLLKIYTKNEITKNLIIILYVNNKFLGNNTSILIFMRNRLERMHSSSKKKMFFPIIKINIYLSFQSITNKCVR